MFLHWCCDFYTGVIINSAYCWLLSNFQQTPSFFSISFCYFTMQAFLAIYVCVCISCLHGIDMALVFASHPQWNRIASTWRLFLQCACTAIVFALQISYFPLTFFCIILFFWVLICSWNQCLVVSLNLLFYLCKFLYYSVLALHVSNFLGFFLFDVLCKCNLFGFYITHIVLVSFFFSFLSFVVYFILFIMSTTMKKVCSGGSTDLVLEVLKNILPITSTPPTPPKQFTIARPNCLWILFLLDCLHQ